MEVLIMSPSLLIRWRLLEVKILGGWGPSLPPRQLHTFLPRVIEYSNAETLSDDKLFRPSKKHSIVALTRDSNGISKLPLIALIEPYKISFI